MSPTAPLGRRLARGVALGSPAQGSLSGFVARRRRCGPSPTRVATVNADRADGNANFGNASEPVVARFDRRHRRHRVSTFRGGTLLTTVTTTSYSNTGLDPQYSLSISGEGGRCGRKPVGALDRGGGHSAIATATAPSDGDRVDEQRPSRQRRSICRGRLRLTTSASPAIRYSATARS